MKRKSLLFLLLMAMFAPWAANAQQDLSDYTFSTGTDATKWISLSDEATTLLANAKDDVASSKTAIGFTFPFGEGSYTEFWVNSNGIFSFNSTTTTDRNPQFKSSYYTANQPKICGVTKDLSTGSDGYVKSELIGTTPNRILVCEFFADNYNWNYSSTPANFKWQIQLHESGSKVIIVYGTNLSSAPSEYQIGLSPSSSDILTINPSTHETAAGSTETTSSVWPGENRYYEFVRPAPACCPKPKNLACTATTGAPVPSATFSWTNGGEETQWLLEYSLNENFTGATQVTINQTDLVSGAYTLNTGLTAEQTYYARIKAYCPTCDPNYSDWSNSIDFKPSNEVCDQIGTGTSTANLVNTGWGCTYSQQIYTATELTNLGFSAGDIVSVSFYYSGTSSSYDKTQSIYMGNTTKSSYSSGDASEFESNVTLVYGPTLLSYVGGWREYELTQPFEWDGTSNLVVGMLTNANNGSSSGWSSRGTSTSPDYRSINRYQDSSPIDITNLATTSGGTRSTTRPNIHLCIVPSIKPRQLEVVEGSLSSSGATLQWQAPFTATPTGYEYQYKQASVTEWPATWTNNGTNLSKSLSELTATTTYDFRVRATYTDGNSNPVEIQFTTLDDCAVPTNLVGAPIPGQGTKATFSWTKGFGEDNAWVLEYGTDNTFTTCTTITEGFTVQGNTVSFVATTGITAEALHYARVKTDCGGGTYSDYSNVVEFTPTNYVDFTLNEDATNSNTTSYTPFYAYYSNYGTQGQFIVPATRLGDVAGGTIRRLTFYTNSSYANVNWGNAIFDVYVKEVENENFATAPATNEALSFDGMTNVYHGSLSVSGNQMVINFTEPFAYAGGNLMIGFDEPTTGTSASASWIAKSATNAAVYSYYSYSYNYSTYSYEYRWTASRNSYLPKVTFNYLPSPYKKPVINEPQCTFGTNTAHIAWTVTGATPTGYQYQYKPSTIPTWPTGWNTVTTNYKDLVELTPGTFYDFRVKALYEGNHESAVVNYEFWTQCAVVTAFPWKEDFEGYNTGNFSHPCWVNEHISGEGTSIFQVYTSTNGSNTTHQLQLPDQTAGTETMLRLPEMNLPGNDYQFVIDVYRNTSTYQENPYELEGIHVYVSTNGNLEGATELAYIPRHKDVSNSLIPAEEETGWYTYEIPVGISGNCYIILKGVNQFVTSIYMDNFGVEQIPTCARPKDLAYSNVTNHSAKLNWTAGDTEQTLWQIAYSKTNFDPNTANFDVTTVNTVDATANPYTFAGTLDAESTYYMYVRANCGTATEPDYGPWNRKGISFTTLAATPAPSNFVATNPASAKVDLVWNAGGGDFESWELYYVASETTPEAPTATTTATVSNITTLPTTEAPYVLEGLDPVTKYFAWIRAKHVYNNEVTYSDWVALTGNYFETLDACPTPTDLVATNLTSVSADLSWVGSDDVESYTVQYRTAAGMSNTVLNEDFANFSTSYVSEPITGWTKLTGLVDDAVSGTTAPTTTTSGWRSSTYAFGNKNATLNIFGSSCKYWLVTPEITLGTGQKLNFDLALTDYGNSNEMEQPTLQAEDRFAVVIYADEAWTILREWNNSGSEYVYNSIKTTGESVSIDLSAYNNKTVKIAFYGESTIAAAISGQEDNDLHIDNVVIGTPTPAGSWANATTSETNQSYTLTGLTAGIKYDVRVKSNCTSGEYCEPISFTTLAEGNMVFTNATNDGKWGNSGNWAPAQLPVLTDEVILRANATIESGCVAEAKKINLNSNTLTIADGGQLKTDNAVTATVKKSITGYGESDGGYCLISTPISTDYGTASTYGMITDNLGSNATPATSTYDLYKWSTSSSATYDEWRNYRASTFSIANGTGYLYASKNGVELTFTGAVKANNTDISKTPSYTTDGTFEFNGWNLYANPFVCDAYINDVNENESETPMAFYRMNEQGDGYQAATGAIHPMEGIFVQATKTGQSFKFTRTAPVSNPGQGNLNINLAQVVTTRNEQPATDNAIIRFGGSSTLEKFSFRENSSKIFIPMEGKNYAVVSAEQTGEIPVSFKAEKNGTYSLNFTSQEVSFSYLHLIDNLTGNDVDLLANPSYSFDAQVTDYAQRFKLVFATGSSAEGDSFGFVNGMGNLCIFGIEGEATVQVIDILGHVITSDTFSGSYERKLNVAPGVYMIRLINGNDVKVQKVVVR